MLIRNRDFLLPPNLLAFCRILLLPFIFFFLAQDTTHSVILALILIALALATDLLDGYLARKLNQITDLGRILDPLADKLGLGASLVFIIVHRDFPIWAAGLLFVKDLLTLIAAIAMVKRRGFILMSNIWGKWNSVIWALMVLVYLARIRGLEQWFLIVATVSVVNCIIQYLRLFVSQYRLGPAD